MQGFGASFDIVDIDKERFINYLEHSIGFNPVSNLQDYFYFNFYRNNNHYQHEKTYTIEVMPELESLSLIGFSKQIKIISKEIKEVYTELCNKFYTMIKNEYLRVTKDSFIFDSIKTSNHDYLINGQVVFDYMCIN